MRRQRWLLILALGPILSPMHAMAQETWRTASLALAGGVTYSVAYAGAPTSLGISVRRSIRSGRVGSVKLQLAQAAWSTPGHRLSTRVVAWHEVLKQPHAIVIGLEVRWKVSDRLSFTGVARGPAVAKGMDRRGVNLVLGVAWRG